ncbi:hypothetical protein GQ600_17989 [Phytophthora cactorum]|nr:hypothetical protein GQ600_17989 [Phytophthora cactorum]
MVSWSAMRCSKRFERLKELNSVNRKPFIAQVTVWDSKRNKYTASATSPTLPRAVCSSKMAPRIGSWRVGSGSQTQGWARAVGTPPKLELCYSMTKGGAKRTVVRRQLESRVLLETGSCSVAWVTRADNNNAATKSEKVLEQERGVRMLG